MTQDPLDALTEFYEACREAPTPKLEPGPRQVSWLIPCGGMALGFVAALAITLSPTTPSPDARRRTVEAIALRQQPAAEPVQKESANLSHARRNQWHA